MSLQSVPPAVRDATLKLHPVDAGLDLSLPQEWVSNNLPPVAALILGRPVFENYGVYDRCPIDGSRGTSLIG